MTFWDPQAHGIWPDRMFQMPETDVHAQLGTLLNSQRGSRTHEPGDSSKRR